MRKFLNISAASYVLAMPLIMMPINALAQNAINNAPFSVQLKGEGQIKTLTSKTKIAIAGYNITSFIEGKAVARSSGLLGGSGAMASMHFSQSGITPELISELATIGYQDLLKQLSEAGVQVVKLEDVKAHPNSSAGAIGTYEKDGSFLGNKFIIRGPQNIGGTGFKALGSGFYNYNNFAKISSDNDATLLFNNLTFNFVNLESSGNSLLARNASVGGQARFILEQYTGTDFLYSRDGRYGDGWYQYRPARIVRDEPIGTLETVKQSNNTAAVIISAALGAGLGAKSRKDNVINIDQTSFKNLALSTMRGYNKELVAQIIATKGK